MPFGGFEGHYEASKSTQGGPWRRCCKGSGLSRLGRTSARFRSFDSSWVLLRSVSPVKVAICAFVVPLFSCSIVDSKWCPIYVTVFSCPRFFPLPARQFLIVSQFEFQSPHFYSPHFLSLRYVYRWVAKVDLSPYLMLHESLYCLFFLVNTHTHRLHVVPLCWALCFPWLRSFAKVCNRALWRSAHVQSRTGRFPWCQRLWCWKPSKKKAPTKWNETLLDVLTAYLHLCALGPGPCAFGLLEATWYIPNNLFSFCFKLISEAKTGALWGDVTQCYTWTKEPKEINVAHHVCPAKRLIEVVFGLTFMDNWQLIIN